MSNHKLHLFGFMWYINALRADLAAERAKLPELQKKRKNLENLQEEKYKLNDQVLELQIQISEKNKRIEKLEQIADQKQIQELQEEINILTKGQSGLQTLCSNQQAKIETLQTLIQELQAESNAQKEINYELTAKNAELDAIIKEKSENILVLNTNYLSSL